MDFAPIVARPLRRWTRASSAASRWASRAQLLEIPFDARFKLRPEPQHPVHQLRAATRCSSLETIEAIRRKVDEICAPLGRRVRAVVNYDGFVLGRDVEDAWADMVSEVVERWYDGVTRYTTSAFLRAKLGDALVAAQARAAHLRERGRGARRPARAG